MYICNIYCDHSRVILKERCICYASAYLPAYLKLAEFSLSNLSVAVLIRQHREK